MRGARAKACAEPVTIANSPPKITSMPPTTIQGGRYEYSVAADDADKDALVYSLEKNPMGMNIDQITGHIEWQIPPGTNGIYRVRVKVMDYQEGFAFQEFDLRFSSFSAAARLPLF
jgi:putative Ig domain-containing protein